MQNLNYLFNKAYYRNLGNPKFESDVKQFNTCIEKTKFNMSDYKPLPFDCQTIVMKIAYPGLIIGMGNPHGVGKDFGGNEEIKTGFSFDYTTGQPYIPASSVKGMLRSYFKEHRQAVCEIIKAKTEIEFSESEIGLFESDVFDYNDIFLDTVVYWGDKYGYMLSSDYITPHDIDHIKNPVPIRILKINPGVRLEFRFLLNDHTVNGKTVTTDMLKDIFTELFSLFGVGAKTNVGYGIMQPNSDRPAYEPEPVHTAPQPSRQPQNNYVNRQRSGNYHNNRNNSTTNQHTPNSAESAPVKIKCPHCGEMTYKYQQDRITLNTECKKCRKPLNLGE